MTQAPATPELVERLRSYYPPICQEAAAALKAQQARIAELAGERDDFQRMYRHWSMIADQRLGASNRQLKRARDLQALADRYEKALREIARLRTELRGDFSMGSKQSDIARQALSSQGRHEGGEDSSSRSQPCADAQERSPGSLHSDGECPTCGSPEPNLYPAVQVGGEVGTCGDAFHRSEQAYPSDGGEDDCPHAGTFRYCAECPVSPCPLGLGRGDNQ